MKKRDVNYKCAYCKSKYKTFSKWVFRHFEIKHKELKPKVISYKRLKQDGGEKRW